MITFEEAVRIGEAELARMQSEFNVSGAPTMKRELEKTIEKDFGWIFFYESAEYLKSLNFSDRLVGNAPLIIERSNGSIHYTGTSKPIEFYIDLFEQAWSKK